MKLFTNSLAEVDIILLESISESIKILRSELCNHQEYIRYLQIKELLSVKELIEDSKRLKITETTCTDVNIHNNISSLNNNAINIPDPTTYCKIPTEENDIGPFSKCKIWSKQDRIY